MHKFTLQDAFVDDGIDFLDEQFERYVIRLYRSPFLVKRI